MPQSGNQARSCRCATSRNRSMRRIFGSETSFLSDQSPTWFATIKAVNLAVAVGHRHAASWNIGSAFCL